MQRDDLPVKTDKGREEIDTRRHGLSLALRRVLIVVDGRTSIGQLLDRAPFGDVARALEELERQGFIAVGGEAAVRSGLPPSAQPAGRSTRAELVALAQALLGANAGRVVKRLEEAEDSTESLAQAVQACHKLIRLVIDEAKAEQFLQRANELISS